MKTKDIEVGKTYAVSRSRSKWTTHRGTVLAKNVKRRTRGYGYREDGIKVERTVNYGNGDHTSVEVVRAQDILMEWDAYQAQQVEDKKRQEEYNRQVKESRHRASTQAARVAYAADQALRAKGVKVQPRHAYSEHEPYLVEAGFEAVPGIYDGSDFMTALTSLTDAMSGKYTQRDVAALLGLEG